MSGLIFTIISIIGTIFLALVVLFNNKKSVIHISLFIFSVGFAGSIGSNYLTTYYKESSQVLLWIRITMFFASTLTPVFYLFIKNFPERHLVVPLKKVVIILLATLISMILAVSPFMFTKVDIKDSNIITKQGPAFFYFIIVFSYFLISSIVILINKIRLSKGVEKNQLRYVLIGLSVSFFFIILFNVVATLIFKNSKLVTYTSIAPLFFIGTVAYAIVKLRLMDIRVIISRSIIYFFLVLFVSSLFAALTYSTVYLFQNELSANRLIFIIGISTLIVIFLDPIKRWLSRTTDSIFFKAKIEYPLLLRELSEIISTEIEIDVLIEKLTKTLDKGLKIKNSVLVLQSRDKVFRVRTLGHPHTPTLVFEKNNPLIKYLNKEDKIIITEELRRKIEDTAEEQGKAELSKSMMELSKIQAGAIAPIKTQEKLNAIFLFGPKLSGDVYGREEIDLIEVLAPQIALAIEKSKLYEEVRSFTQTLQSKIDEATAEIKSKNIELEEANIRLKQLDQAKTEFVSIASHQLRTPMTGIMGYLSMLTDGDFGACKPEHLKILKELLNESQRMIRLINQFLNVSKIEAGKFELAKREMQLEDLIAAKVNELNEIALKKSLKLVFIKPKEPLPKIFADPDKLNDIILNLIDNGIKYTAKGGVTISVKQKGDEILTSIKDTGIGISKEDAKELFGKFQRGTGVARIQPDGSGLGLFLAKNVVEGHKGKIWVESAGEGKGSTFFFTLPIKK
ncbi:MAG: ATP-binding protein [Patescibacteria group bacterium]